MHSHLRLRVARFKRIHMEGMHDAHPCYSTAATGGLGRRYGLVTMCIGGGQALAAIFERP